MARLTYTQVAGQSWIADQLKDGGTPIAATAIELAYLSVSGTQVVMSGTDFRYDELGQVIDGTVSRVRVLSALGDELFRIDCSASLATLVRLAFGSAGSGSGDGGAVLRHLLRGNDLVIGSGGDDTLWGGVGAGTGDDTVRGGTGNDLIRGDAGSDVLGGGAGLDRLDYQSSYTDGMAYRGIVLNVAAGTVTDCWGGLDRISGFESYGDSAFGDSLTGSDAGETFALGAGRDVLAGGLGVDWLDYGEALSLGGRRGILADLAAQKVVDPFGFADQVIGVEGLGGTALADVMRGDAADNSFDGRQGVDSFDGREGRDRLGFWGVEGLGGHGVQIDMTAAGAQVLDDGFGNAERVTSIESFTLSGLGDSFVGLDGVDDVAGGGGNDLLSGGAGDDALAGDGGADTILGGAGRDWIEGGAGHDELTGGDGADSFVFRRQLSADADTIHGFVSGEDRIWLAAGWIGLPMTGIAARHVLSGDGVVEATTAVQRLLYDTGTGILRYDRDGMGTAEAEVVAVLSGQEALTWRDFAILT
ncbi:calcium-binding protein [Neotabrizicola shimadae]|uniref:Calcium-binding protein n=1 Tax=Neotabrizicola shimadae TaxID=2807096 RepID=A0A8G0ZWH3_9RHOB|nr:calcium-binding protein [Neotabrizicola shimadae]QYZ71478.1 hypothetical protein JO391_08260 [Neotabrizicola shimadae]